MDPLVALTEEPNGYADGNPANREDPTGLFGVPVAAAAVVLRHKRQIQDLADDVGTFACNLYGVRPKCKDSGIVNAVRHFVGSALVTHILVSSYGRAVGLAASLLAQQAHEIEGFCSGIGIWGNGGKWSTSDAMADQQNNALGTSLALTWGGVSSTTFVEIVKIAVKWYLLGKAMNLRGGFD